MKSTQDTKVKDLTVQIAEQRKLQYEAMEKGTWHGDREIILPDGSVTPAKRTDTRALMTKRLGRST